MANLKTTKCIICGKTIEYATKKPKWCQECKTNKNDVPTSKNKSKHSMQTKWKGESQLFKVLDELMPSTQYCVNGYYSWLPSPKGSPMQLDWFSYELGLAFEYQGPQHYKYNKYFHKKKGDFKYLQECDELKKELCDKEGITLVEIKHDVKLNVREIAHQLLQTNRKTYDMLIKDKVLNLTKEDIEFINNMGDNHGKQKNN